MENAPSNNEASNGTSALDDGLGVAVAMMTNDELAEAIAYTFDRCDQKYVGGYTTSNTEPGKVMLEHLKELLAVQRARAGMVTTSNVEVSRNQQRPQNKVRGDAQFVEAVRKWRQDGTELHLVMNNGNPQAAYARRLQAEIYASGFSKNDGVEIITGIFTPNGEVRGASPGKD